MRLIKLTAFFSFFLFLTSFTEPRIGLISDDMLIDLDDQPKGAALLHVQVWEDGILPLDFQGNFTDDQKSQLLGACAEWSRVAPVKCVEGSYKNRTVMVTSLPGGCWAMWGMGSHFLVMGRQINLANGCWSKRILLHELGHAFGLIHEHQRPDRDDFITIHSENVEAGFLGLQNKINFDHQESELKTPYDFKSVMHYSKTAFSKNGKETIVPLPKYSEFKDVIGTVHELSPSDAAAMTDLYKK